MATRITTQTLDDITAEPGASTVDFGLDGVGYEIDLTDDNAAELRESLAIFVRHARRTGRKPPTKVGRQGPSPRAVRRWAQERGIPDVPSKGRIPKSIRARYDAEN